MTQSLARLVCVLLIAGGAALGPFVTVSAQSGGTGSTVDEILVLLQGTETHVNATFAELAAQGVSIPPVAEEARAQGTALAGQARELHAAGETEAARGLAEEAFAAFRNAVANLPPEEDFEAAALAQLRTQAAVERLAAALTTLQNVSAQARAVGLPPLDDGLAEAQALLLQASQLLAEGDVSAAAQVVETAQSEVVLLMVETTTLAKAEKRALAEAFLLAGRARIAEIEALLDGLPLLLRQLVQTLLSEATQLATEAETLIEQGDVDAAVPVLQAMSDRIEEAREQAESPL